MLTKVAGWIVLPLVLAVPPLFIFAPRAVVSQSVTIIAPPARVWAVLTDLPDYPRWNDQMLLFGTLRQGAVIENIQGPGPAQIVFWPTVLVFAPNRALMWRGHLPVWRRFWIPRLLDADHQFLLRPAGGDTVFTQSETFHGVLLWVWDARNVLPDFQAMDRALRARAEAP